MCPFTGSASAAICWCATAASAGVVIGTHGALDAPRAAQRRRTVQAECRRACARLARQCVSWGLGPAEFFAGIPGTVGGALAMNAGAFGGETWRARASRCETIDRRGVERTRARLPSTASAIASVDRVPRPRNGSSPRSSSFERRAGAHDGEVRELLARRREIAADRRVELRLGVHQPARRSRRAPHRGGGPEGLPHRRCVGFREARQFHHQPRRGTRRRPRAPDRARAATVEHVHGVRLAPRGADRRGVP